MDDGEEVDRVTILQMKTAGAVAAKRWAWHALGQRWDATDIKVGEKFGVTYAPVRDVDSLGNVIETLRPYIGHFIIRGQLKPGLDGSGMISRKSAGKDATFIDLPRRWFCADIDNWTMPAGRDITDPDDVTAMIPQVIADRLPPCFSGVRCYWKLSGSAGIKPGMRVHIWFWFDRPIEGKLLGDWLEGWKREDLGRRSGLDLSLTRAVHPHYVADPIIEGAPAPIDPHHRAGWVESDVEAVTIPDLSAVKISAAKKGVVTVTTPDGEVIEQAQTVTAALARMGDGPGLDGFHKPLLRAGWLFALETPSWRRPSEVGGFIAACRAAVRAAPKEAGRDASRYLSAGYLEANLQGAFARIEEADGWATCKPLYQEATATAADVQAAVGAAIGGFMADPWFRLVIKGEEKSKRPRRGVVIAEAGIGKTEALLNSFVDFIARMKAAGEAHRIVYMIPFHFLGADILERALSRGIKAATYRSRSFVDADQGIEMCLDPEALELTQKVGGDVADQACGGGEKVCDQKGGCPFYLQLHAAEEADLVLVANTYAFNKLPPEVKGNVGLIVLDEAFWQSGINSVDLTLSTFQVHPYVFAPRERGEKGPRRIHLADTDYLMQTRAKLVQAFVKAPDGYVDRQALVRAGLTIDDVEQAAKLEWRRKLEVEMVAGMPIGERKSAHERAALNKQISRMAAIWKTVRDILANDAGVTGRIELTTEKPAQDGSQDRRVHAHMIRDLSDQVKETPVLMLDATGNADMIRRWFWHEVEVLVDQRAASPNMEIRQFTGALGLTALNKSPKKVATIVDYVRALTRSGSVGVITHLAFEKDFAAVPGVITAHFGALAGRDDFREVRHLVVLGKQQPDAKDAKRQAAALTGEPVPEWQPDHVPRGVLMVGGAGVEINVSRFGDPRAEEVRAAITDAGLVQAIGRARGVRRPATAPVTVHLFANAVVPWPVSSLQTWDEAAPGPVERMAARGVVYLSPVDAVKAYPDLFESTKGEDGQVEVATKALQDVKGGNDRKSFYKGNSLIKAFPIARPITVQYQATGKGQNKRLAVVDADHLAGFHAELETMVGALARFQVIEDEATPTTPPWRMPSAPYAKSPEFEAWEASRAPAQPMPPIERMAIMMAHRRQPSWSRPAST